MSNFDRLRVLICDHLNLARGKYIPYSKAATQIELCLGVYAVGYHREVMPAPGGGMLEGYPDMQAIFKQENIQTGWEEGVGVVVADLFREDKSLPLCPRNTLKRAEAQWNKEGFSVEVGIELEAYLFKRTENGEWLPHENPSAYVYGTGQTADPDGVIETIWKQSKACGFELSAVHSEFDPAQFEFTLKHKDALSAIDEAFLFRLMAMEVCSKAGYKLSFMPKPINDRGGSGFHINFSLIDKNGNNAFSDESKEDGLSKLSKDCIAGLLNHHQALAGIQAPSVNSYRRLRPGSLSAHWANWGYDHRGAAVRIPKHREQNLRLEHRLADGAANPYIATAATLHAARLGYKNNYKLIDAETNNCNEISDSKETVKETLGQSLEALEADQKLRSAIGQEIIEHHLVIKRDEWQRFLSHTSDWELNEYFNFL